MKEDRVSDNIKKEMLDAGIDLSKFPEDKHKAVCELYGYKFDNENVNVNSEQKSNVYVPKLKKPNNREAAYVDALVLALVTGLFGGIFLTVVSSIIK